MVMGAVDRVGGSATDGHEAVDREQRIESRPEGVVASLPSDGVRRGERGTTAMSRC